VTNLFAIALSVTAE